MCKPVVWCDELCLVSYLVHLVNWKWNNTINPSIYNSELCYSIAKCPLLPHFHNLLTFEKWHPILFVSFPRKSKSSVSVRSMVILVRPWLIRASYLCISSSWHDAICARSTVLTPTHWCLNPLIKNTTCVTQYIPSAWLKLPVCT